MTTKIDQLNAAWNLSKDVLPMRSRSQVASDCELVAQAGTIPLERALHITEHYCASIGGDNDVEKWVRSYWPEHLPGEWDHTAPAFGHLVTACLDADDNGALKTALRTHLWETFFCDSILQLVGSINEEGNRQRLVHTLAGLIQKWNQSEADDTMSTVTSELMDFVITVAKGLHCALCVIPGKLECTHDHLNFVWPNSTALKKNSMFKAQPKLANRLQCEFQRCEVWATLVHTFRQKVGGEAACQKPMQDYATSLTKVLEDGSPHALAEKLEQYQSMAPTWKKSCREGCTEDIDSMLRPAVQRLVNDELNSPASSPNLANLETYRKVSEMLNDTTTAQLVQVALLERVGSCKLSRISSLVVGGLKTIEDISETLGAWRASLNDDGVYGQMKEHLMKARPMVQRFIAAYLRNAGTTSSSIKPAIDLADMFIKEKGVHSADATTADIEIKSMVAIKIWATQAMNLKDALWTARGRVTEANTSALLTKHQAVIHHRAGGKHKNFDAQTQAVLNDITSFVVEDLEQGDHGVNQTLSEQGTAMMEKRGEALRVKIIETAKWTGGSHLLDGGLWYNLEDGWPANATALWK